MKRLLSWSLAALTVVATLHSGAAPAAAAERPKPAVPSERAAAEGALLKPRTAKTTDRARAAALTAPPAFSPAKAGSADVAVGTTTRFGGLGVSLRGGAGTNLDRARVQVLEPGSAGGTLFRVKRADTSATVGATRVSLDYRGLADSFGGDYGARLRLYRVPECAVGVAAPPAGCTPVEIPAVNDTVARTVSADVTTGAVFALAAAEESAQGNYAATKLSPSSTWDVNGNSGALNWSYPMRTPPVPGDLAPQVTLGYSSQAVDGRTAATNNQGSWVGEGFTYEPGFIERRFKSCKDDGHDNVADLCWARQNASIVLSGSSGELVKVSDNEWRLPQDDGTRVKRLTGATNGDDDGEYWQVVAPDGVQYFFGQNRLPGWSANRTETNSTWTVPVYGDDKDEPCYNATFANAWCQQAWRWNLDYVKDARDNVIAYYYDKEKNAYARGAKTDVNGTTYDRGGFLKRIDYGQRHNAVYTTNAPARVQFAIDERCIATDTVKCGVGDLKDSTAANWPDVPFDQNCALDTKCKITQAAPTFWTRKRLTAVTTEIRTATDWSPVDTWNLTQIFTDNGDGSRSLWLRNIGHEGRAGGSEKLPTVDLAGIQLPNRIVKANDNIGGLIRFRLATVWTDAGAQLDVTYAAADCSAGNLPKEGGSTRRCFPVKWHPNTSDKEPVTDWFHKYVVSDVVETDLIGRAPDMVKHYDYLGDAGWRYNEPDGITESKYFTWGDWRGYADVRETRGDGQTMTERTDTTYLRGLDGDKDPDGGTRRVTEKDSTETEYTDDDKFAGLALEEITYNGAAVVSKTITKPWRYTTATQSESWGKRTADIVRPQTTRTLTALAAGGWRETRQETAYETTYGVATQVDNLGDVATGADDQCTRTWYTAAGSGPQSLVSRVETVAARCSATVDRRTQVISDVRTYYDSLGWGAAPTNGEATRVEKLKSHNGTTATYVTESEKAYDDWGRVTSVKDAAGKITKTGYTHTYGLLTSSKTTNAAGHDATTEFAPAWGEPTVRIDANSRRSELVYDPLGRLVNVWLADRSRLAGNTPSTKYTYLHRKDLGVAVRTETIETDGSYETQYDLYDGHLRMRQTQTPGPDGGRLVTETLYDGTGKTKQTNEAFYAEGAPEDRIRAYDNGDASAQVLRQYDGAGRETAEIFAVSGTEKWRTTTSYGGDRVHVNPPAGGTAKTTILDADENPVELREYHGDSPTGSYDTTRYEYTADDLIAKVTGPGGEVWNTTYDQRRRKLTATDPDSGTVEYGYDDLDRETTTKDAEGNVLTTVYDDIGRKTAVWQGAADTGTKLTAWTYDTADKGQLYSTAHYTGGKAYGVVYPTRDEFYRPLRTRYVIPDDAGNLLKGTYEFTTGYNRDGSVSGIGMPAAGGLPAEGITYGYDALERPTTMEGTQTYVTRGDYGHTGLLLQTELNSGGKKAWLTWSYEEGTNRLDRAMVDRQGAGVSDVDAHYRYDASGNLLSIVDKPVGGTTDAQCFTFDHLRRMTEAWTSASTAEDACAGDAAATGVGGPEAYHHSYSYDVSGNRTGQTVHGTGGAADIETDYAYPAGRHTVTAITGGGRDDSYQYDKRGNTTVRTVGGRKQDLKWDSEGHLQSVTEAGKTTSYVYGPDGARLVRKEPTATTVYLPGMELRLDTARNVVEGTRYYVFGGRTVATRTTGKLYFLGADHHGTDTAVIDAVTGAITRRRTAPFGEARGAVPGSWPTDRTFVGGTADGTTGLVHVGAREYDPGTGRFISDDPLTDHADSQQMNGYAYANNNPVTFSDPSGLRLDNDADSGRSRQSAKDSPHNLALAAMFAMALAYLKLAKRLRGELTMDINDKAGRNKIPGARQDKDGDGRADMIFREERVVDGKKIVQVWEVKPGGKYGQEEGKKDLANYIKHLQKMLGDGYRVQPGEWLPPVNGIPTGNGRYIRAWMDSAHPGLIFYGEGKAPKPPKITPRTQPRPEPGRVPAPAPTGVEAPRTVPAPPGTGVQPIPHPGGPYGTCPGPGCVTDTGGNSEPPFHWDPPNVSAKDVGTGIATGIAFGVCLLLCWLSPATA
jgi:RHS repeat-associated protein